MAVRAGVIGLMIAVVCSPTVFAAPANAQPVSITGFENGIVNSPYTLNDWAAQGFRATTGSRLSERTTVRTGIAHGGGSTRGYEVVAGAQARLRHSVRGQPTHDGCVAKIDCL